MKQLLLIALLIINIDLAAAQSTQSLEAFTISSEVLKNTKVGLDPEREIRVWLPPSYHQNIKRYPVVYYIHNIGWDNTRLFTDNHAGDFLEEAFKSGRSQEFIFVAGDFTTPSLGTFFGNNAVSGRWFDHISDELVPAIDKRYRTLAKAESRGLAGDFLGGYAAIKTPMLKPGLFSSVYALHPVGTDSGNVVRRTLPDWGLMNRAQTWDELNGFALPFMLMAQAHTPNPNKPPFYADLMMEFEDGKLTVNDENIRRLSQSFDLRNWVIRHPERLRKLKGFMFDWGRYDENQDHVYGNQKFTRMLDEFNIAHQAEEYRGGAWDRNWVERGRIAERLLPFFEHHLTFQ